MINPAEDIVNIWLQEFKGHFVKQNIVLRQEKRIINNKNIYGGKGKEVDFLSTDGKSYYWIEVSVSVNPYLPRKSIRRQEITKAALNKFEIKKEILLKKRFGGHAYKKWFVYSPRLFTKKSNEEAIYIKALNKKGIKAISFKVVLDEVFTKLDYMGLDSPRQYLYLLKKFGYKIV